MSSDKKQGLGLYDNERYRGHLSLCEIDLPGQRAIAEASVGVVGAGGLGSPVVLYLAAAGVGRITVVDDDCVELSNLQRQIMHGTPDIGLKKVESARKAVMRINPEVEIVAVDSRLSYDNGEVLLGGCGRLYRQFYLQVDGEPDMCPIGEADVFRLCGEVFGPAFHADARLCMFCRHFR